MYIIHKVKYVFIKSINFFNFIIEKIKKQYIIGKVLERRLMVGQEILVLFIMVRIRAPQPKIQPPLAGGLIFAL